jgi:beta-galactosidase
VSLEVRADTVALREEATYDVATIRIRAVDQNGNTLPYYLEPVQLTVSGPVELIGPAIIPLRGGMGGAYLKTKGGKGKAALTVTPAGAANTGTAAPKPVTLKFEVQ